MPVALAPVIDLAVVLVFAATGRRSHGETGALEGILATAWPFLVGTVVGWLVVLATKRTLAAGASLPSGVIVWLCTIGVGMLLRQATDKGTAVSFIIVSLLFTGALMLGWRGVRHLVTKRR